MKVWKFGEPEANAVDVPDAEVAEGLDCPYCHVAREHVAGDGVIFLTDGVVIQRVEVRRVCSVIGFVDCKEVTEADAYVEIGAGAEELDS